MSLKVMAGNDALRVVNGVGGDLSEKEVFCPPCTINDDAKSSPEKSQSKIFMQQKVHVLDIAGGKGQLSLELILQQIYASCLPSSHSWDGSKSEEKDESGCSVRSSASFISHCTIIDPMVRKNDAKQRQMKLKRAKSHVQMLRQQRRKTSPRCDGITKHSTMIGEINPQVSPTVTLGYAENVSRIISTQNSTCNANQPCADEDANRSNIEDNNGNGESIDSIINHLATRFTTQNFSSLYSKIMHPDKTTQLSLVQSLSSRHTLQQKQDDQKQQLTNLLLLGLHPDQCTEDILDVAIKHNLSVALVPSCVFPDLFPSRKIVRNEPNEREDLASVRTYSEFLQYLMEKDDGLQMATLPFEGKNVVIYKNSLR